MQLWKMGYLFLHVKVCEFFVSFASYLIILVVTFGDKKNYAIYNVFSKSFTKWEIYVQKQKSYLAELIQQWNFLSGG